MRTAARAGVGLVALVVLCGCPSERPPEAPDAGRIEAVVDAGVAAGVDAGPPVPLKLTFAVTARADGGEEAPVAFADDAAEIDPVTGFTLTTPVRLKDYRVRLFDWADQVVASDDTAELGDAGLVYRIDLLQPVKTGRRYTLVVDAELAPEIADEAGRTYDDVRLGLKIRGEVQPDKPAKKPGKKKKK